MEKFAMENTKKLGFGLMRLPKKGSGIDVAQTCQMVDLFMEAGFTYYDTAYYYTGSEEAAKKALVERYPRERFTFASKLYAPVASTEQAAKQQFYTSLERSGAGYFDYYLLHSLMKSNYAQYERFHLWDFAAEQKRKGLIRHFGFSFHDGPELLERILSEHPEVEFVQLQINYADWESASIASRANYEIARKYGKPIVVMEPIKGGNLANPPAAVKRLFESRTPALSCASWAIRFAASLDGIVTVLSGMSNVEQTRDNISFMRGFTPFNEEEQKIIREAQRIMGRSKSIPCTSCSYCTKGCPKRIAIPEIFSAMNRRIGNGQIEASVRAYATIAAKGADAARCIACGQCERSCPQHIKIIGELKNCAAAFAKSA